MKKLRIKYNEFKPSSKLLLTFLFNCIFWLLAAFIQVLIGLDDESFSWKKILFQTVFMGIFWTIIFSWKLVKQCFSTNVQQ